ncbi:MULTISPECIES: cytochrome c oxidase subunit II [Rhodomicrobium]|uniref:cytochrome c oxidase subunit II n=2 Tax=Rhodomicrobium TaxID=1068 RepID=UPI000B4B348D
MLMSFRGLGLRLAAGLAFLMLPAVAAFAAEGRPENWQIGFQPAATPVAEQMHGFHDLVLVIMIAIVVFVTALLIWVMVRYNAKANPVPSKNAHNTTIEVAWTIIPVLILLVIAIPSFRLLYAQYDVPKADVTIKVTGHQWYWSYVYPDHGGFGFDSLLVEQSDIKPGQTYLLSVDNEVVVPVNKVVHLLITSDDVIHDWAIPAFGTKVDAMKGRNSLAWFQATETGTYYGQCSELCGARHAFMPIAVRVVSDEEFAAWVEGAKQKFTASIAAPVQTAGHEAEGAKAAGKAPLAVAANVD